MAQLNIFGYSPVYEAARILLKTYQDHPNVVEFMKDGHSSDWGWYWTYFGSVLRIHGYKDGKDRDSEDSVFPEHIRIVYCQKDVMSGTSNNVELFDHTNEKWFDYLRNIYNAIPDGYSIEVVSPNQEKSKKGYIYLIQAIAPQTYYKIGLSKNPKQRIKTMGVKLPFPIEPIHQFPTDDMYSTEKALHEKYANKRVNGEWFELSPEDVAEICAISEVAS